jgi:hypothetical protein
MWVPRTIGINIPNADGADHGELSMQDLGPKSGSISLHLHFILSLFTEKKLFKATCSSR